MRESSESKRETENEGEGRRSGKDQKVFNRRVSSWDNCIISLRTHITRRADNEDEFTLTK